MGEDFLAPPAPPRPTATVTALPGAPPRALDGRLLSDLTWFEMEVEVMKRRLRGLPPLGASET